MNIELTEKEKEIIGIYLKGEFDPLDANDEQRAVMSGVIDKANELQAELNAYDESGNDLVRWFWYKYNAK